MYWSAVIGMKMINYSDNCIQLFTSIYHILHLLIVLEDVMYFGVCPTCPADWWESETAAGGSTKSVSSRIRASQNSLLFCPLVLECSQLLVDDEGIKWLKSERYHFQVLRSTEYYLMKVSDTSTPSHVPVWKANIKVQWTPLQFFPNTTKQLYSHVVVGHCSRNGNNDHLGPLTLNQFYPPLDGLISIGQVEGGAHQHFSHVLPFHKERENHKHKSHP